MFKITKQSRRHAARAGLLTTRRGALRTPFFMPIATKGAVKTMTPDELLALSAEIILGNTYHLYLRPGLSVMKKFGGLHGFMRWDGPILTDSGGYQVFSLGAKKERGLGRKGDSLVKISEEGVQFRSHLDGSAHL